MMLPRFSLRWILGVTTACAGLFTVASFAMRGHAWAAGLIAPVLALMLLFLLFLLAFCAAFLLGSSMRGLAGGGDRATTPFGHATAGAPFAAASTAANIPVEFVASEVADEPTAVEPSPSPPQEPSA